MFRKMMKIADIKIGEDRRPVHYETVKGIAESFKAVGQINPVIVDDDDNLIAGLHRIEAGKLCEWTSIEAGVVEAGDEADLMEVDENLQRHNLDALQFSRAVAKRKRLWEAINGKADRGAKPQKGGNSVNFTEFKETTAAVAEVSVSTVEKALTIGEKLTDEAAEILEETKAADNKTVLAQVAALPPAKQPAAAKRAAAGKPVTPKPKDESKVVDSLKGVVADSVRDVFECAKEWSSLMSALSSAKGALTKIVESGTACWLDGDECARHIAQARALLAFAMPFTECCKCRRNPKKDCQHCKGKGWLTKANYNSCASDADKAWLEKRATA